MTVKEAPKSFVATRVDTNTLSRLKVLAGTKPVARYLRELSLDLTKDVPVSLDDLRGGESLTPIKRQLDEMSHKIDWLIERVKDISVLQDSMDGSLSLNVPGYDIEVRRLQREYELSDMRTEDFNKLCSESPEYKAWREHKGRMGVIFPGFVYDTDGHVVRRPDGTPEVSQDGLFDSTRRKAKEATKE